MTQKELEKIGFTKSILKPSMYWFENTLVYIQSNDSIKDILKAVYEQGKLAGIELGKEEKIKEIKNILDIKDLKYE